MARLRFKGLDEYVAQLERISMSAGEDIERAVYAGAGVVADEIKKGLKSLRTSEDGLDPLEKEGLIEGFGLAKIRKDGGYVNTKAGFAGLSRKQTKRNPAGIPNATIARQIESGTSWIPKQPVIRSAVRASKDKAERAMAEAIEKAIKQKG